MAIKLSNSGMNRYSGCGKSYYYHYVQRYRPLTKSSALLFGSAIDAACNYMLENFEDRAVDGFLDKAKAIFLAYWDQQTDRDTAEVVDLAQNPFIKYFKSDYDGELLTTNELEILGGSIATIAAFRALVEEKLKTTEWLSIPEEERVEYNIQNWFSLRNKGMLMLDAYFAEILPNFKRIFTVQHKLELTNDNGDIINGIAEFVGQLQDDRICLTDNKTAGSPYSEDSVRTSQQLALYKQMLNIQVETGGEWQTHIDCAAYAVMGKKMQKITTKTCTKCGNVATSSHKTCNRIDSNRARCDGDWTVVVTFKSPTQFLVDDISDEFGLSVLENMSTVISCVEKGIFPKNFDKCYNDYGGVCSFLHICHKKDPTGLIKLENANG